MTGLSETASEIARTRPASAARAAGNWIIAMGVMYATHLVTAVLTISPENDVTLGVILVCVVVGIAVTAGLLWLGIRVRRGQSLLVAVGVMLFMVCGALIALVGVLAGTYYGTGVLLAVQAATAVVLLVSTCMTVRASLKAQYTDEPAASATG